MARNDGYTAPTPEEYAVVKKVWEKTGVMTVKDGVTAEWLKPAPRCGDVPWQKPWQDRPEYGEDYSPKSHATNAMEAGFTTLTKHRRAARIEHIGTPEIPTGVRVGGVEVWTCPDVFGAGRPECVRWQSDVGPDEEDRLYRWARGIHHVTEQEYAEAEREGSRRRANMTKTQQDPAGALTEMLGKAIAAQRPEIVPVDLTEEQLRALGVVKGADGKWTRSARRETVPA